MVEYTPESYTGEGKMPTLYTRTASGAINQWTCWSAGKKVLVEWGQVDGVMQTAQFDVEQKNVGRANETTVEVQATKEAIAKWKKQVKKKYFLTIKDADSRLNLKPMLAHEFKKRLEKGKVTFPVDVQPKLDGVRCFAYRKDGKVFLQSRGGDPYPVGHIMETLEPILSEGTVLDGELYIHGESLQNIVSLVKRPQEGSARIDYRIYDITHITEESLTWAFRREGLRLFFEQHLGYKGAAGIPDKIQVVGWEEAQTAEEVKDWHDAFVKAGFEGAIVRQHHGLYRFGYRSHELLKLKEFQDDEFLIIGWTTGKGKFTQVPIFKCITKDGKEFDVAPMGTDEERLQMLQKADEHVGKNMTVRFFDWTDDKVPHFPVGVSIREPGT